LNQLLLNMKMIIRKTFFNEKEKYYINIYNIYILLICILRNKVLSLNYENEKVNYLMYEKMKIIYLKKIEIYYNI